MPFRPGRTRRGSRASRRRRDRLLSVAIIIGIFVVWFFLGMPGFEPEPPVRGNAVMRDGDTIDIGDETFRLAGIDALEFNQTCTRPGERDPWPCGRDAARALARHIRGRQVSCEPQAKDRFGRTVARCTIGDEDIAEWMVVNGWAFDSSRFGDGPYVQFQDEAAAAKRGAWAGEFTPPWDWRPTHPSPHGSPPAS